jgi:hypothetical protein
MRSQIKAAWDWLPVIVRAIVLGWVLLTIGSTVTFLPLFGNLKFHPEIPWAFPMTLIILALYWAYFSGWGLPPQRVTHARSSRAPLGPSHACGVPRFRQFCSASLHLLRCDCSYRALCWFARPRCRSLCLLIHCQWSLGHCFQSPRLRLISVHSHTSV